jgi:uncharacterized repeat protein (TIGR03803 family)
VDLTVSATGSPPLSYQWLFDGSPLSGASSSELQLAQVQLWQAGIYTVVVTNDFGAVTSAPALLGVVPAPTFRVLHEFNGSDGAEPSLASPVLAGTTLYGTAYYGGYYPTIWTGGEGTLFRLNTDGTDFRVLEGFVDWQSTGCGPSGNLVLCDNTLYGTAAWGGISNRGTVFKLATDGSGYTVLKSFAGSDGSTPFGGLAMSESVLYGTTYYGGSSNLGTVFRINTDGSGFRMLRSFTGADGCNPEAPLVVSGGTLYGTTGGYGGPLQTGGGTVFKLKVDGTSFTVLKAFTGSDGATPMAGLLLAGTTLYGTTAYGGGSIYGTVFRINTDGSGFAVLKSFNGGTDGASPEAGLALAGTTLYGTTCFGGPAWDGDWWSGDGLIFQINTDGTGYSILKQFTGGDGSRPGGQLLLSGTTLYGLAENGGSSNNGVVFSFAVAQHPSILSGPMTQTAEDGAAAGFGVRGAGTRPLMYQWLFDGTQTLACFSTNSYLLLPNVQPSQAGTYTVVIANAAGMATSSPAMLQVIVPVERRPVPGVKVMGQPGSLWDVVSTDALSPAPDWTTLGSVSLISTSQYWFDLTLPLPPQRFYRAWQTGAPAVIPSLDLHMVPAITLTGSIGGSVRVDAINRFGPIDAWFPLDTVTLTNTSQLYFDTSAWRQQQRLYRLVQVP